MPTITAEILVFILGSIPLVAALWKIFAVRSEIEAKILAGVHRLDLLEQKQESLDNQQLLMINGQQETLAHVRDRSKAKEQELSYRLFDVERYLEKTTDFEIRRSQ